MRRGLLSCDLSVSLDVGIDRRVNEGAVSRSF